MLQLHAIMDGLDVRPTTDADLLGALILKSAAYQADHAGLEIDICTIMAVVIVIVFVAMLHALRNRK